MSRKRFPWLSGNADVKLDLSTSIGWPIHRWVTLNRLELNLGPLVGLPLDLPLADWHLVAYTFIYPRVQRKPAGTCIESPTNRESNRDISLISDERDRQGKVLRLVAL